MGGSEREQQPTGRGGESLVITLLPLGRSLLIYSISGIGM